jgi:DNA-binding NarL/FixJ family response regulator
VNQVLELYVAMERVRRGDDPLKAALDFFERNGGKRVSVRPTHRRRAEIIHLWRNGLTVDEIAARTGTRRDSVHRTIRELHGEVVRATSS